MINEIKIGLKHLSKSRIKSSKEIYFVSESMFNYEDTYKEILPIYSEPIIA